MRKLILLGSLLLVLAACGVRGDPELPGKDKQQTESEQTQ
jgi:predicted small lipoprotein YifL